MSGARIELVSKSVKTMVGTFIVALVPVKGEAFTRALGRFVATLKVVGVPNVNSEIGIFLTLKSLLALPLTVIKLPTPQEVASGITPVIE